MTRPLRVAFAGAVYHLTTRGNAREAIFIDDADRRTFLRVLAGVIDRYGWLCHAWCLMGNHYHLLVETPDPNLSLGMRQLNGVYTRRFNARAHRVGHLFQGRFRSVVVERETHLLELCRYIVLNPVRAKMVATPSEYRWSSYRPTVGLDRTPSWLTTDWVLAQFGSARAQARAGYVDFVREGIGQRGPWCDLNGILLGSATFAQQMAPLLEGSADLAEIPRRQRLAHRPTLSSLLAGGAMLHRGQRDRVLSAACLEHGYTLTEIARAAGLHYSTVSRIVARGGGM
jgi:putative transposase